MMDSSSSSSLTSATANTGRDAELLVDSHATHSSAVQLDLPVMDDDDNIELTIDDLSSPSAKNIAGDVGDCSPNEKGTMAAPGDGDGGGKPGKSESPKEEVQVNLVAFKELFRFASRTDRVVLCIAAASSIGNGLSFPLWAIIFGTFSLCVSKCSVCFASPYPSILFSSLHPPPYIEI